jgi:hypothetical protein
MGLFSGTDSIYQRLSSSQSRTSPDAFSHSESATPQESSDTDHVVSQVLAFANTLKTESEREIQSLKDDGIVLKNNVDDLSSEVTQHKQDIADYKNTHIKWLCGVAVACLTVVVSAYIHIDGKLDQQHPINSELSGRVSTLETSVEDIGKNETHIKENRIEISKLTTAAATRDGVIKQVNSNYTQVLKKLTSAPIDSKK